MRVLARGPNGRAWRHGSEPGLYGRGRACCPGLRPKSVRTFFRGVCHPPAARSATGHGCDRPLRSKAPIMTSTRYLEPSPLAADGGHLVGIHPRRVEADDLRALGHPESPLRAIRAKCIDCSGGNDAEARKCVATSCALWPYRMGGNPFDPRSGRASPRVPNFPARIGEDRR